MGGVASSIPNGWHLCDGNNGTPDLRDRFVAGAGNTYSVGDTGGADEVSLTTEQMPSHTHVITDPGHFHYVYGGSSTQTSRQSRAAYASGGSNYEDIKSFTSKTGITISDTGTDLPHENRPPYYALCFIMKL